MKTVAIPHAQAGEIVDVRPLGPALDASRTATLVKTQSLEIIRLVLPSGKQIPPHQVAGEIAVQCLEGRVELSAGDDVKELAAGELVCLAGGTRHALRGIENATVLVTILL